jgi:hypothetical protein
MTAIRSVCVYCGSSQDVPEQHRRAARRLGQILAEASVTLVYGGGRVGLMGIIADAALGAGGQVIGIIPQHLVDAEAGHGGVTELYIVDNMHERKRKMFDLSDGFAVLPGGIGTLDETFEMMSWRQLRLHDKPIVLVNEGGYWAPLLDLIEEMVTVGYAKPAHLRLLTVVDRVEEVLGALQRAPEPAISPAVKWF